MALVHFHCSACGRPCFRYAAQYERMRRARGQAWCLACAPGRDAAPIATRELCDVSQRLIAWSHQCIGGASAATPAARSGASQP